MSEHVVLVHGLFFRSPVMAWLAKRLRSAGFVTHLFNYKTRSESLPVLAQQLNQFVSSRFESGAHAYPAICEQHDGGYRCNVYFAGFGGRSRTGV